MELNMHDLSLETFEKLEPAMEGIKIWDSKYLSGDLWIKSKNEKIQLSLYSETNREKLMEYLDRGKFSNAEHKRS